MARIESGEQAEGLFLGHLRLIDRLVDRASRKQGLRPDEVDDFRSWARVKLIDDDYAILRKYQGRSTFEGFLAIVVLNLARDFRIQRMGKWRPSAAARRHGEVAVRLETLVHREGFAFDEAVEMLRRNFGAQESEQELHDLAARLPPRQPRQLEGGEAVERLEDRRAGPFHDLRRAAVAKRANRVLAEEIDKLGDEDRLLLRLRFRDGHSVARIARLLKVEQRPLYPKLERLFRDVRRAFEAAGLDRREVLELVGWRGADLEVSYGEEQPPDGAEETHESEDVKIRIKGPST